MRILIYSDLHLEFGSGWSLPPEVDGDLMILAGDIITLPDYEPLGQILQRWKKPALLITGNHEYYTRRPMNNEETNFKVWLESRHPLAKLLLDEDISINGVNFFGGVMWTDFNGREPGILKKLVGVVLWPSLTGTHRGGSLRSPSNSRASSPRSRPRPPASPGTPILTPSRQATGSGSIVVFTDSRFSRWPIARSRPLVALVPEPR